MTHVATSRARGAPALALIAAVARNGVIGAANALPWRLPEDLKRFRALTTGHAVIMGRKTWESLPRPLPGRQNIVITRQPAFAPAGADVACSLPAALDAVRMPAPAFCIGGGEIYAMALPHADTLHVTEIDRDFAGDTRFPAIDPAIWGETAREQHRGVEGFDYAFVTYTRGGGRIAAHGAMINQEEH